MRLTIKLVDKIYRATGVNITLLTSDEWRHADPIAQKMLIEEYCRETKRTSPLASGNIPKNYMKLLIEANNYFFTTPEIPSVEENLQKKK